MNFKDQVIQIVKKIPYGRVTTYGTVAIFAGVPRGARLVGGILHFNEMSAPWHRVINRHGFISTKCLDHPKQLQKALLQQEGIEVSDDFMINLKKYGWRIDEKYLDYC
ncbi:MGMT family protein [Candidatus Daviesbacteria bacterium]|nr:MGMT family protein [Candidatus Daviesbacteria bacterium]